MLRIPFTLPLCLLLLLAGCATVSRNDCAKIKWGRLGEQDGSDGRTDDRFLEHAKSCGTDESGPARAAYLAAREKGLAVYCTSARGYREGTLGQQYLGVCPPTSEPGFQSGYKIGQRAYQIETRLSEITDATHATTNTQEKQRLATEEAQLKQELEKLRDRGDALVRASRKKKKAN